MVMAYLFQEDTPPIECILGDNFRINFFHPQQFFSYLALLTLLFSVYVFSKAMHNIIYSYVWAIISALIFIQSAPALNFMSSFICTTPTTPYVQNYWGCNLSYALVITLTNMQTIVDLIWIYIYNESYFHSRKDSI